MAYSESGYESDLQSAETADSASSSSSDGEPARFAESDDPPTRTDDSDRTGIWRDDSASRTLYTNDRDWNEPYARAPSLANQGPFWALRRFFRRLFGAPEEALPVDAAATHLAALARESLALHPHYGNQSVAHVAERMGFDELGGKMAYEQVDHMRQHWSTLADSQAAQQHANAGGLVVAGSGGSAQAHTAIVVPGPGATAPDGAFYPNVACGGLGEMRSDGSRTVADVWPPSSRGEVEYFAPR
ncbi:MAG: hypothetical protein KF889_14895 [Alphaproteobacteria bacterium]|nr:hypothetical protein [Alphaproteobacteria bacterium]MCW5744564.1 hypothetical protein [Alphaproteobacteria bacterium]